MVSKRERAKQRKAAAAAKSTTTSNNAEVVGPSVRQDSRQIIKLLNRMPTTKIVGLVKKGDRITTTALSECIIKGISYKKSGVLSAVLGLLQRCQYETFDEVMSDVGGDLNKPHFWVDIVVEAEDMDSSCHLQIAQNIGPLVECMCDDMTRTFFKSNQHWKDTILPFVGLIYNLLRSSTITTYEQTDEQKQVLGTLLQYEGLLTSIIQWGFWGNRRDIAEELEGEDCTSIIEIGVSSAKLVVAIAARANDTSAGMRPEDGKKLLFKLGTTPIVNKEYDPACMVSFAAGFARQMKKQGEHFGDFQLPLFQSLIVGADCVDKGIIAEIINLGTTSTTDLDIAERITRLLYPMILQNTAVDKNLPCDTRAAYAIRAGLIEMCLSFIERFGKLEGDSLLHITFKMIHDVSLHQKTAKAIRSKRGSIEKELVRLEQNTNITNNPKCKKLLDMVRSILNLNGSYCCRCSKSLTKTEVMECNGCHCMAYCSEACQRNDWVNGHSLTCCKSYTDVIIAGGALASIGFFQGRAVPQTIPENERAAAKLKELEKNISMIQLKLFLDNSETILSQVEALDIPLYDCVVMFDLRECPSTVTTASYIDRFNDTQPDIKKSFEEIRSKENITCHYSSRIFARGAQGEDKQQIVLMQRLFPHEWLKKRLG